MNQTETGTVTLEPSEHEIVSLYLQIVVEDNAATLGQAARWALSALPHPDPAFTAWLLQGEAIEEAYKAQ